MKGSSSIACGDIVVGETWKKIQELNVYPYFDRVESKANPVDGLSRGCNDGPCRQVIPARLPDDLAQKLTEPRALVKSERRSKAICLSSV